MQVSSSFIYTEQNSTFVSLKLQSQLPFDHAAFVSRFTPSRYFPRSTVNLCWPCTLEVAQSTGEIQGDVFIESEKAFTVTHAKHAVDSSQKQLEIPSSERNNFSP